jgi:hypothetical protein
MTFRESPPKEQAMPSPTTLPTPKTLKLRPRYLRAIPSLVVLTTAMAWGALPDWDVGDELHKKAGVTQSQALNGSGSGDGPAGAAAERYLRIK